MAAGDADALAEGQLAPFFAEFRGGHHLVDAFGVAVTVHHQVVDGHGGRFQQVDPPDVYRVHAQFLGHHVHHALEGEAHVHGAMTAHGAVGRGVGEHAQAMVADIGNMIDGVEQRARVEDGDDAVASIGPAPLHHLRRDRLNAAIPRDPHLELGPGGRPAAVGQKHFLPAQHHIHRRLGLAGQQPAYQLIGHCLGLAAEPTAHHRLDQANLAHVQLHHRGDGHVHVIGHLRRAPDVQPLVERIPAGHGGVGFHLGVGHLWGMEAVLQDHIAGRETRLHVPKLGVNLALDIAFAFFMQGFRPLGHRLEGIEVGRQGVVFHHDGVQGLFGRPGIHRGHRGDAFALVAHLVPGQRILVARQGQHAERHVALLPGDHRSHARHGFGRRNVDGHDAGVRVGAAQDASHQGVRKTEIRGILAPSGGFFQPVDEGHGLADELVLLMAQHRSEPFLPDLDLFSRFLGFVHHRSLSRRKPHPPAPSPFAWRGGVVGTAATEDLD